MPNQQLQLARIMAPGAEEKIERSARAVQLINLIRAFWGGKEIPLTFANFINGLLAAHSRVPFCVQVAHLIRLIK